MLDLGLAPSTRKNYNYWWSKFEEFGQRYGLDTTPPNPEWLLCAFAAVKGQTMAHSTIRVAISAIRSHHIDQGLAYDTANMLTLKRVIEGVSRVPRDTPIKERLPITTDLLARMRPVLDLRVPEDIVFFAIACVGTYGLLRSGEIFEDTELKRPGLRRRDLRVVSNSEIHIYIAQSKTDQRRKGAWVELHGNGSPSCPTSALFRYLDAWGQDLRPNDLLFQFKTGKKVNKATFIKMLRYVLKELNLDPLKFSGHSFRRGGATSLAAAGVPAHIIKAMGRWKSVAYQLYIEPTKRHWIQASQAMAHSPGNEDFVALGVNRNLLAEICGLDEN